jgi:hypothetical protein
MATSDQTLFEFTENLLSDLENGLLTPQEAMAASSQYAYLREALEGSAAELSQAALLGDEEFAAALQNAIKTTLAHLKELPSFQSQQPDNIADEKAIRDTAQMQKVAADRLRQNAAAKTLPYKEKRRAFIHGLVDKFSSTMPTPLTEQQAEGLVDHALVAAAGEATTAQTKERFAELIASAAAIEQQVTDAGATDTMKRLVLDEITHEDAYVSAALDVTRANVAIEQTIFHNPSLARPDVLVDVAINAPTNEPLADALTRGVKLAQVAEALEQGPAAQAKSGPFFDAGKTKGIAKGLEQASNGILSLVGEPLREMIVQEKVNGTLRSLLTSTQQLSDRLGETFVRSALFTQISQNLARAASEGRSAGHATGVFDDIFSSIFRGPLDPAIQQGATERVYEYFELARASAVSPKGRSFLSPATPISRAFPQPKPLSQRSLTPTTSARRSFLSSIGFGVIGTKLGDLFASGVDSTTSFFLSNPRMPWNLWSARRAAAVPTPFWEDLPLVIAVVVVIFLIVLFVFPGPLNLPLLSQSGKVNALLAALIPTEASSSGKWPVPDSSHACILEGPYVGTHSLNHLDAMDFLTWPDTSKLFGAPVSTQYAGTVVEAVFQYPDNSGYGGNQDGGTYGNHVLINTDKGGQLLFAHLRNMEKVHQGQHVSAGTIVGYVDHTGYSFNPHLHYEARGANLDDFTPFHVPSCEGYLDCKVKIALEGHSSCL